LFYFIYETKFISKTEQIILKKRKTIQKKIYLLCFLLIQFKS
jgi:hypothetical protein